MSFNTSNMAQRRSNPFARSNPAAPAGRPKSAVFSSPSPLPGTSTPPSHSRAQSQASYATGGVTRHHRSDSKSNTNTFAPSFINTEDMRRSYDAVKGIEGENDFSGKRYVWLKDPQAAFVKGWVVEELSDNRILVQCDDGTVSHNLRCTS